MSVSSEMAINPSTGDFWVSSQPEYWDCVAQAWKEIQFFSPSKQRHIDEAKARAQFLRGTQS